MQSGSSDHEGRRAGSDTSGDGAAAAGPIPRPESIVTEFTLAPPVSATRARMRAGAAIAPVYRIVRTNQVDEYEMPVSREAILTRAAERAAPPSDDFGGTARRVAKLSIADAETEEHADVAALIASLPSIDAMKHHVPVITTTQDSRRVEEEKRNVRLRAFIYAASREDDNDFHLIVGREPGQPRMFITMELSGLPPADSPHRQALEEVREAYKAFFQHDPEHLPGTSYDFYKPPIEVEIEGSLFFDMTHASGSRPGPKDLRPDMPTVWEVHPVTRITFEP
jgi:hypothetical protein